MQMRRALICFCLGWPLAGWGEDLTTLTGLTYTNVAVQRYDWEGIFIKHSGGISKIHYNEIQADQRDHYRKMAPPPAVAEKPAPVPPADVGPNDLVVKSGQVYRNASVRRVEAESVLIHHDGGMAKVPFADIPDELQEKFRTPPQPALETPLGSNDLATTDGQIYRQVQVRKIEPDGLTIRHEAGLAKLVFPLLPEDWQKKYEYDPQKAAAYRRAAAAAREQAEKDRQANRAQNAAAHAEQVKAEPFRIFEVSASKTGEHEYRVHFSVRNYDDKPQKIVATIAPMAIREFILPANAGQTGLEVVSGLIKPETLVVKNDFYSTSQVLDW